MAMELVNVHTLVIIEGTRNRHMIKVDIKNMKTPYYVFYADDFINNYHELENTFQSIYSAYHIAYSFKTNYTPAVCKLVRKLGGYAEVVSDMEYELARRIGFADSQILYNGPGKGEMLEHCLLSGGHLHVDNFSDVKRVIEVAGQHKDMKIKVGVRVNFDVGNTLHSRFGLDLDNGDYRKAVEILNSLSNVKVNAIHFHISRARGIDAWEKRINKALSIADDVFDYTLDYIDIGSGMYGHLDDKLQAQFGTTPSYKDYAKVVAERMYRKYQTLPIEKMPKLITEPGTTVVSKYFHLFTRVLDIKEIRGKHFALLDSSFHNVGEICGLKNVPIINHSGGKNRKKYNNMDLVGYTCLEQDVISHNYAEMIGEGDKLEILNVGGYSIVDKPPFIHPDIPIYMVLNNTVYCIKREQTIDDIFAPYYF